MKKINKAILKDTVLTILKWLGVTIGAFAYWMFVLLLLSIFLMNIWKTSIYQILKIGVALTVVTSVVYLIRIVVKKLKN